MTEQRETKWIPNFGGEESTAENICNILTDDPDLVEMTTKAFTERLRSYKSETGLPHIYLSQLRDWAVFQSRLVPRSQSELKQSFKHIAELTEEIARERIEI